MNEASTRSDGQPSFSSEPAPSYWRERLAGRPPALELPTTRPRPAQPTTRRARLAWKLEPGLASSLSAHATDKQATVFELLLAAWAVLLYRLTRQGDLLVGLHEGGKHAALRLPLGGQLGFDQVLERVREELQAAREQALELSALLRAAHCTRTDALFQTAVTGERASARDARGLDLLLSITRGPKGAPALALAYDAELFDEPAARRLLDQFATLLAGALAAPGAPIGRLPLLSERERAKLLVDWNDSAVDFPREATLHALFEQRARVCPDAPAVVCGRRQLTYAALDARANRLAQHLRSIGVGPDVLVGICAERSLELVVGLLAIAKAGGAYVPLDPAYPRERLAFLLEDSRVGVLLTHRHLAPVLPEPRAIVRVVPLDAEPQAPPSTTPPESGVTAEHLAYAIYTSGSTGKPKGVLLDHRGRVNNFLDFNRRFAVRTGDALLALASLSFDMCAYDVFGTLAAGATVVMPRPEELHEPRAWARLMAEQRVTIWHTAPAVLQMLVELCEAEPELAPRSLRLALLGGDWIPVTLPDRLRALAPGARVVSMGGATECSMDSTIFEIGAVDPSWRSIPYGKPMANQKAYVLDEELQPVPVGVAGELYLGGVGVGRGYYQRPELTAERFLPDPFATEAGARMYRTGDLARWMEDGNLELLGRVDNQVKIRGYRIELGEIEARLRAHPAVREGVVVARAERSGERALVAYVVPRPGAGRLAAELRAHLAAELPGYMVPARYVELEALPLSPNGKVDRKRLPEPEQGRPAHLPAFVAPRDALEELVAGIWTEVLACQTLGVDDPFLELGGHSILAAQIQARLAELLPFEVALRDLFEASTVAALARHLRKLATTAGVDLEAVLRTLRQVAELSDDEVAARLAAGS
jgi:amino acid adenylation domain-containing protein